MNSLRFGFYFLITMVSVRILTLIAIFNPAIYWISPLYAIMELLLNLNLDNDANILVYIIYPSLFYVPWLIIYMFILFTSSNRFIGMPRFLVFSVLGVMGLIFSMLMNYTNYNYAAAGEYNTSLMIIMSGISGFLSIISLLVMLLLPNFRYLTYYKIIQLGGFILNYVFLLLIIPLIAYSVNEISVIFEIANLFFGFINILAFYYLMRYLEYEQGDEFITKETYEL